MINFGSQIYGSMSTDAKISILNALGTNYTRDTWIMSNWPFTPGRYNKFTAAGKKVLLNINYAVQSPGQPFPTDLDTYKTTAGAMLDSVATKPEVVVCENEETNGGYHEGDVDPYIAELTALIEVCQARSIKVANGGIHPQGVCYWVYEDFVSRGMAAEAAEWKTATFNAAMISEQENPNSNPGLRAYWNKIDTLLTAFTTLDLHYVNLHIYEPINNVGDGVVTIPGCIVTMAEYVRARTGKEVISNEWGQYNTTGPLTASMMQAFVDGDYKYGINFSGDTDPAVALENPTTFELRANGIAFRDFVPSVDGEEVDEDNTPPVTIVAERPHKYSFSKNEIRYVFQLDDLDRPGLYLQIKLFYGAIGTTPATELETFLLKPDADGKVYLYIEQYLHSLLNWVLPDRYEQFTNANDQARSFFIHFREIDDDHSDPEWDTTEEDYYVPRIVLKGGIEKNKNSRNNFFINYCDVQKPFLTWQPTNRFIFKDEKVFLTFLNAGLLTTGYSLVVNAFNTLGESVSFSIAMDDVDGLLVHAAVDADMLTISSRLSGTLYYYEVSVKDGGGVVIVNPYRFYIEYRPLYEYYDLTYINSISGIDTVRVIGDVDYTYKRKTVEGSGGIRLDDWTSSIKPYEQIDTKNSVQKNYKGNVGNIKTRTRKFQFSFVELLVSPGIYMKINTRWVPVINLQESQNLGNRKNTIDGFPIEWSLSESNEVYTPDYMNFGDGTIADEDHVCQPPVFGSSTTLPNARQGVAYNFSIAISGDTPFDINNIIKPGLEWMTIEVVGSNIEFTGTPGPDDVATNLSLSFDITNCSEKSLPFSDTINVAATVTGGDLSVELIRMTSPKRLIAFASGGTGPYTYHFYCIATGACQSFTIDDPDGTLPDSETGAVTTYSTVPYGAANYEFFCRITDAVGNTATSGGVTEPFCLVPETLIMLKDGSEVELRQIEVGDILHDDVVVTSKTTHIVNKLHSINKGLLKTSDGHINILKDFILVTSEILKVGDVLLSKNFEEVPVTSIEIFEGEFEVVNISTTTKTYIANGMLTHNKLAC